MQMRLIATIALGVAAIVSFHASAQQLYRWVDKNGKINYTQDPPPRDAAKSVQQQRLKSSGSAEGSQQMPFAVRQAVDNFPVSLYTSPECPQGCKEARDLLVNRGVPYREISVSDNAAIESLKKVTGNSQVPVLLVGRAMEVGFAAGRYNAALDQAGYPVTSQFAGKPPMLPPLNSKEKPAAGAPADDSAKAPDNAIQPVPAVSPNAAASK